MAKKRVLRDGRDGRHDVPGLVDSLIRKFMTMVIRGRRIPKRTFRLTRISPKLKDDAQRIAGFCNNLKFK